MFGVLKSEKNIEAWYSAFFQVAGFPDIYIHSNCLQAGLCIAQARYQFKHNDCHSENVRVRLKRTTLYYQLDDLVFAVPTYGNLYVLIDFGRF
jgi:hypothetical protein